MHHLAICIEEVHHITIHGKAAQNKTQKSVKRRYLRQETGYVTECDQGSNMATCQHVVGAKVKPCVNP
jgi:hypothetical protein